MTDAAVGARALKCFSGRLEVGGEVTALVVDAAANMLRGTANERGSVNYPQVLRQARTWLGRAAPS